jgi:hypothetical protein
VCFASHFVKMCTVMAWIWSVLRAPDPQMMIVLFIDLSRNKLRIP